MYLRTSGTACPTKVRWSDSGGADNWTEELYPEPTAGTERVKCSTLNSLPSPLNGLPVLTGSFTSFSFRHFYQLFENNLKLISTVLYHLCVSLSKDQWQQKSWKLKSWEIRLDTLVSIWCKVVSVNTDNVVLKGITAGFASATKI